MEIEVIKRQKEVCAKYGVSFFSSPFNSIIGVAIETFSQPMLPINGLRHQIQNDGYTSWYIWGGEYSSTDDFFKPLHVNHLLEICPQALDYLGLEPGWRFLFDNKHEDVWHDENLLIL